MGGRRHIRARCLVVLLIVSTACTGAPPPPQPLRGRAVVSATIRGTGPPNQMLLTEDALWVNNGSAIVRIDPVTNRIVARVRFPSDPGYCFSLFVVPGAMTINDQTLWVTTDVMAMVCAESSAHGARPAPRRRAHRNFKPDVTRIDTSTNRIVAHVPIDGKPDSIAVAAGAVWVSDGADDVLRIDPATNAVVARVERAHGRLFADGDTLWVQQGARLGRVDTVSNRVASWIPATGTVLPDAGVLWFTSGTLAGTIDPRIGQVEHEVVLDGSPAVSRAVGEGVVVMRGNELWRTNPGAGTVERIDARTGRTVQVISLPPHPQSLAVGSRTVWVGDSRGVISRLDLR